MLLSGMSAAGPVAREAGARTRREPALPPIPGVGPPGGRRRGWPGEASFGDPPGGNARRGRIGRRSVRAVRGAVSPLRGERGTPGAGASFPSPLPRAGGAGGGRVGTRIAARPHLPFLPPAVTPDLFRGPACQAPLSPGFPRIPERGPGQVAVRGKPGPRNKSGVTRGAGMASPMGTERVPKPNRTAMDPFRPSASLRRPSP